MQIIIRSAKIEIDKKSHKTLGLYRRTCGFMYLRLCDAIEEWEWESENEKRKVSDVLFHILGIWNESQNVFCYAPSIGEKYLGETEPAEKIIDSMIPKIRDMIGEAENVCVVEGVGGCYLN